MIADKRYDKMSKHMVELAYRAWEELMVEKMKKAYEDIPGDTMKKAAKVVVAHLMETWGHDKQKLSKETIDAFQKQLMKAFST